MVSPIADTYFKEANSCFLHGNYIPFITMLAFAFEVMFRAKIEQESFEDLIKSARKHGIITAEECQELDWLHCCRKSISDVVDQVSLRPSPREDCEIDFYGNTAKDIGEKAERAFKLVRVFNEIQCDPIRMGELLQDAEDRREPQI